MIGGGDLRMISVAALEMLARNPQRVTPARMTALRASIRRDGFLAPILVRPLTGDRFEVLSGNHRALAAREEGLLEVPALVRVISDADAKRLAVNLNTIHGEPDPKLLAEFLADLDALDLEGTYLEETTREAMRGFDAELAGRLSNHVTAANATRAIELEPGLRYRVILTCRDEAEQRALLDRFTEEGLECRALIS